MAPARSDVGERISSLEATLDAFREYEKTHWHDLNNTLQPLVGLPVQMARDIAKLEAKLEAKLDGRLAEIDRRLTAIEGQRQQMTGAKQLAVWLVQTVIAALAAVVALRGHT
jgi:hypothetical protein